MQHFAWLEGEVDISINGGDIVNIYGLVPCVSCPHITNFLVCLMHKLLLGEMVESYNGYQDESTRIRIPVDYATVREKKKKSWTRARHEKQHSLQELGMSEAKKMT
jgi:hypothetical protein